MKDEFWRELTKQSELDAQYEILLSRGDMSSTEIAMALARFAEAHIFNAADRYITAWKKSSIADDGGQNHEPL